MDKITEIDIYVIKLDGNRSQLEARAIGVFHNHKLWITSWPRMVVNPTEESEKDNAGELLISFMLWGNDMFPHTEWSDLIDEALAKPFKRLSHEF